MIFAHQAYLDSSATGRFERLFGYLVAQTSQAKQVLAANRIDRYVTRQALALFLVAPQVLYAVNRDVK